MRYIVVSAVVLNVFLCSIVSVKDEYGYPLALIIATATAGAVFVFGAAWVKMKKIEEILRDKDRQIQNLREQVRWR